MEKIVEQTLLYDFYGELLTEHQRTVYEDVVMNEDVYKRQALWHHNAGEGDIGTSIRESDRR